MNKWLWLLFFAALGGVGLGEAFWQGFLRVQADQAPTGWAREANHIQYKLAALQGEINLEADEYALDFYRGIYAILCKDGRCFPAKSPTEISLTTNIPPEGQLEIWLSAPPTCSRHQHHQVKPQPLCKNTQGLGIVLERIGDPSSKAQSVSRRTTTTMECSPPLLPPTEGLQDIALNYQNGRFMVHLNGNTSACQGVKGSLPAMVRPGIREVHVSNIILDGDPVPDPTSIPRFLCWLMGALCCSLVVGLERHLKARSPIVLLTTAPIYATWWLASMDMRVWVEALRAAWMPWRWAAFIIPLFIFLLAKTIHLSGREFTSEDRRFDKNYWKPILLMNAILIQFAPLISGQWERLLSASLIVALPLAIAFLSRFIHNQSEHRLRNQLAIWGCISLILFLLINPLHIWGAFWAYGLAMGVGVLVWANALANQIKGYNPICLLACCFIIVAAEGALRGTQAGYQWSNRGSRTEVNDAFGWVSTINKEFDAITKGEHTTYPTEGYPVSIPKTEQKRRLVSFGGSSTGGAFQNDDLNQFYPALIQRKVGKNWQVINQGVGGWTSWHIERYIGEKIQQLQPDVATFYIGHNDLLTFTPVPYKQLYAAWASNSSLKGVGKRLSSFRLYQALRYFLLSLRPAKRRAAVPIDHAKENILKASKLITSRGGKVILASEGLAPDPGPLASYNTMMSDIAKADKNIFYVDIASKLHHFPSREIFLDDCHLTSTGHEKVASMFSEVLEKQLDTP